MYFFINVLYMYMKKNNICLCLLYSIIIILFFVIIYQLYTYFYIQESFESNDDKSIELVISRYNEDLQWLNDEPFNKHSAIVYNKGINDDFNKSTVKQVIPLKNVGREGHTYLYHIIHNYDNLADITVFLPGSADMSFKIGKAKQQVFEVEKHKKTVFIGKKQDDVRNELYDFTIDEYVSSNDRNSAINNENELLLANPRPFGKWYDLHFKDVHIEYVSYIGILAISREHIRQHPKEYYEKLIEELSTSSNPEVGHYYERAWNAVFYPLHDAIFITGYL